jgi:hypothetical protein
MVCHEHDTSSQQKDKEDGKAHLTQQQKGLATISSPHLMAMQVQHGFGYISSSV